MPAAVQVSNAVALDQERAEKRAEKQREKDAKKEAKKVVDKGK